MNLTVGNSTSQSVLSMLRRFVVEIENTHGVMTSCDRTNLYIAYDRIMLILEENYGS